jgi:2-oxoisovalerate dehydrogenase E2 component (dihydrolipoyl transacylase)
VTSVAGEVGDTIAVGTPLIVFATGDQASAPPPEPEAAEVQTRPKDQAPVATAGQAGIVSTAPTAGSGIKTSPSIRQRAREAGIDLHQVPGTGPRGRILQVDFEAFLAQRSARTEPSPAAGERKQVGATTEIRIIGMRRKIAQHLEQANQEVPHFSYVEEVDVSELESLRRHLNSRQAAADDTLTLLPFIGMALIHALPQFPQCNAHYDKERNVLIQHHAVHLGIATQTTDGLKVPVVRHASERSLDDLAREIRRVTSAARDNSASRDELTGSTITLTSLGKLGGIASTPIINLPEVAIIGVNNAVQRPVVLDGQITVRTMMNLSSSFDHRFVDGHDAASLIQIVKQMLEHPATIFMQG